MKAQRSAVQYRHLAFRTLEMKAAAMADLKVGQKLYFVYSDRRRGEPYYLVVKKVGRKWATTSREGWTHDDYRIDVNTLWADAGHYTSPGRCYISKEDYDEAVTRQVEWDRLREMVKTYNVPQWMTREKIAQIAKLLDPVSEQAVPVAGEKT
jgi:hypothetical protein